MSAQITNDRDFSQALDSLELPRQRQVAALFVDNVLDLSGDERLNAALAAAKDPQVTDETLKSAYKAAKRACIDSHARCGTDGDWRDQAGYFVARAAEASVAPSAGSTGKGPAWRAAMSSRMARTCLAADSDEDAHDTESRRQYEILERFLNS